MTEMAIQQLLADAGATDVDRDLVKVAPRSLEVPADWAVVRSPETYLGSDQATGFASPEGSAQGEPYRYGAPNPLSLNHWAPSGTWVITGRAAALARHLGVSRSGSRPAT